MHSIAHQQDPTLEPVTWHEHAFKWPVIDKGVFIQSFPDLQHQRRIEILEQPGEDRKKILFIDPVVIRSLVRVIHVHLVFGHRGKSHLPFTSQELGSCLYFKAR